MARATRHLALAWALTTPALSSLGQTLPLTDAACVPEFNAGNHCVANSLSFKAISIEPDRTHCDEGDLMNLRIGLTVGSGRNRNAAQRYNLGIWIGENGEPAIGGSQCTFTGLQPITEDSNALNLSSGSGPYRKINNDSCGDILDSELTYYEFEAKDVLCRDANGNGKLDIPIALGWHNNANQDLCSSPTDEQSYFPRQSSACREITDYDIDTIVVEPPADVELYKTAAPRIARVSGTAVTFEVELFNESNRTDVLTLNSLVDDQFGDLNGKGTCATGGTLASGARYQCEFQETLSGTAGSDHTNTITAALSDSAGRTIQATASAKVLFINDADPAVPDIRVLKVATPHSLMEPGGEINYLIEAWNDGETDLTLTEMLDSQKGGSLNGVGNCVLPQTIATTGTRLYSCSYTHPVDGRAPNTFDNTVTATAQAPDGTEVSDTATATVTLLETPAVLTLKKLARPLVIRERTTVTYEVVLENHSPLKDLTITSLVDNYHGDLTRLNLRCNGVAITGNLALQLPAAGSVTECTFVATVPEAGEPVPTEIHFFPDTVTASGFADNGQPVSALATAEVLFYPPGTAAPPVIEVNKVAAPDRVPASGAPVAFTVEIINGSASEAISLTELVDDIHGNLSGRGTCPTVSTANPQQLAAGQVLRCTFSETVSGTLGGAETDTITAAGTGIETAEPVFGFDSARVDLVGNPLAISIEKTPSKRLTFPGDVVEFTLVLSNDNNYEVTATALQDSVFGDLNGQGTCSVPTALGPNSTHTCVFSGQVASNAFPRAHINVVTLTTEATGPNVSSNRNVQATDRALVLLLIPGPALPVPWLPHVLLLLPLISGIYWLARRRTNTAPKRL